MKKGKGRKPCDKHIIITKRRLINNKGTYYISLPRAFIERQGLTKGSTLPVIADSIIKIVPMTEIS